MKKDQSLGIMYNMSKKNKMSKGGAVKGAMIDIKDEQDKQAAVPSPKVDDAAEHYSSIADAILAKHRQAKMMAEGGRVDIESNAQEDNADAAVGYEEDAMDENYDSDIEDLKTPLDSIGDDLTDEDKYSGDLVSAIRKKKAKRS